MEMVGRGIPWFGGLREQSTTSHHLSIKLTRFQRPFSSSQYIINKHIVAQTRVPPSITSSGSKMGTGGSGHDGTRKKRQSHPATNPTKPLYTSTEE